MNVYFIILSVFAILMILFYQLIFKSLSIKPVAVILLFVTATGFLYHKQPFPYNLVYLNLILSLSICSFQDMKDRYITARQAIFLGVSVVIVRILTDIPPVVNLISVVMGFLLLFVPYLLSRKKGLGIGDVIALTLLSVLFTPVGVTVIFLMTTVGALIYGGVKWVVKKEKSRIPLIPFMQLAVWLYLGLKWTILKWTGLSEMYHLLIGI